MVVNNVLGLNSAAQSVGRTTPNFVSRIAAAISRQTAQIWCGLHGHIILLHFQPNKLSLQCGLCGYESAGWEVGRPLTSRRTADNRTRSHHDVRTERRRTFRAVPSGAARMAS